MHAAYLERCVCVWCAALVNTLHGPSFNYTIHGITVLDSELYVLRTRRKTTDIAVFDMSAFVYVFKSILVRLAR